MNENEMTEEQMEEATNPFAGMAVDGDESVKGVTESEQQEMQDAVDTNNDGVISEEELDSAVDKLAEIESSGFEEGEVVMLDRDEDAVYAGHGESSSFEDLADVKLDEDECENIEYPTIKSLSELYPQSADDANMSHQQDWARHCAKFAKENNCHFLGLSVKDSAPMFKEKK